MVAVNDPAGELAASPAAEASLSEFDKLRRLLAPPVFPGDESKTRNAAFLNVILLLGLALQILAPVFFSGSIERRVLMTALWTGTVLSALALMRRGRVRLASVIHIVTSWLLVTLAVATCGGVRAPGFSGYIVIAGCAGMLLGWQAMLAAVAAGILTGAALMHAEATGLLDPSKVVETPLAAWLTGSVMLVMAAVHIGLAMGTIGQTLKRLARELEERKATEEKLREHQEQLQSLSSRLLLIEERERRSFSRLLHDHIGQNLTYAKLRLGVLVTEVNDTGVRDQLSELSKLIEQISQETRSLTYELSPPLLYEIGLDAALDWLAEHFQERYKLACRFEGANEPDTVDIDGRIVMFQSARELLFNVVKHAKAKSAIIACHRSAERVSLSIRDDGVGFDPSKLAASRGGFGLFNVKERIQHAGGELKIESSLSGGTAVTLSLPMRTASSPRRRGERKSAKLI